ncbi:MAG TPA: hypothetical protein VJR89_21995 [Polyangiales bacterium]|nr:hypothetical protein [Polyangiales bacterium]
MTQPFDISAQRRALLRGTIGAVGSLLVAGKLSACGEQAGATAPPPLTSPPEPAAPKPQQPAIPATPPARARPATPPDAPRASEAAPHAEVRSACPVATSFPAILDLGPRAGFKRMDRGDELEWVTVGFSAALYADQLPDTILGLLRQLDLRSFGYPLSVLAHSLQTATRARRANASDELVLCALCHQLGCAITVEGQAELSAAILRGFVSEEAYRVVRHQDEFQLLHYGAQVGRPPALRERYAAESWYALAQTFCDEWDSPSYASDYAALPLEAFEPLVRAKLGPASGYLVGTLTSEDCIEGAKS